MKKFENAQIAYLITRSNHHLVLRLSEKFRYLNTFVMEHFSEVNAIDVYFQRISSLKDSLDVFITNEECLEMNEMYSGNLIEEFDKYLTKTEEGYTLSENDFVLEKLKVDNNVELMRMLIARFPEYGKSSLHYSDNLFNLCINKNDGFLVRNINPIITEKFSTIAFENLLTEMKNFICDYQKSNLPGLTPIRTSF